ncbi:unnamed protein product [Microthlaspi erraticum]|uniref:J domain-containing protein n=1 Tax=Microthlaspi erraticum TaxID=1685480 RepID=A0A6D2KK44_9BRAS|nr:unnamed protein product [Microthlaspi erraticum]
MECNKEEAKRAMDIAERKISEKDYVGAKKFVTKAQRLYPKLDGLEQISVMIDVNVSASNKNIGGESDWYGRLGLDPKADDQTVKKRYKKLALLLHPDKNRFRGAEDLCKLVLAAWSLLSDKAKRLAYDEKRKSQEAKPKKREAKPPQQQQWRDNSQATNKKRNSDASSTREAERLFKKTRNPFSKPEAERVFKRPTVDLNSTREAERLFKTTRNPFSNPEADRVFKTPMTAGDPNSTAEAQRLFKRPL